MEREKIGQRERGRGPTFLACCRRGPAFEQRVPDQRQQRELGERCEQRVEGVLAGRPLARGQILALLRDVSLRPTHEGIDLGVGLPELGQPDDHLEDEAVERPLSLEDGSLMVDLARGEQPAPGNQHHHRASRPQRELPAIVEQQRIAEDREHTAHQTAAGRPGQHLADEAHTVRPIRQIAGDVASEEGQRQREQLAPHRGLESLVDPGLDPQHGECADHRDGGGDERTEDERRQRGGPHRDVHPGDDLGQQLAGHDRGQQGDEGAQAPHERHNQDVPTPAAQGLENCRQATVHAAGKRRVEHHTVLVERLGPPPVHRGRLAGDGVDHPVGTAPAVDDRHRPRLLSGDDAQEGRSVAPLPSGGQPDPTGAEARGRHDRVHYLERVAVDVATAVPGESTSRTPAESATMAAAACNGLRCSRAVSLPGGRIAQDTDQLPEHRLLRSRVFPGAGPREYRPRFCLRAIQPIAARRIAGPGRCTRSIAVHSRPVTMAPGVWTAETRVSSGRVSQVCSASGRTTSLRHRKLGTAEEQVPVGRPRPTGLRDDACSPWSSPRRARPDRPRGEASRAAAARAWPRTRRRSPPSRRSGRRCPGRRCPARRGARARLGAGPCRARARPARRRSPWLMPRMLGNDQRAEERRSRPGCGR